MITEVTLGSPKGRVCLCVRVGVPEPSKLPSSEPPEPPRFIKEPKDQIGVSGGVASFVCQATGDPKPRVTWNKKGKKVNSQRFEVSWAWGGGATRRPQLPSCTPHTTGFPGLPLHAVCVEQGLAFSESKLTPPPGRKIQS